jgi:hypothetical protein
MSKVTRVELAKPPEPRGKITVSLAKEPERKLKISLGKKKPAEPSIKQEPPHK